MKRTWSLVAVAGVILLAGCSPKPAPVETPQPAKTTVIEAENADSCEQFETLTVRVPAALETDTAWESLRGEFDLLALRADGATGERMKSFVDAWPEATQISILGDYDGFNQAIADIERACLLDGNAVAFAQLVEG